MNNILQLKFIPLYFVSNPETMVIQSQKFKKFNSIKSQNSKIKMRSLKLLIFLCFILKNILGIKIDYYFKMNSDEITIKIKGNQGESIKISSEIDCPMK